MKKVIDTSARTVTFTFDGEAPVVFDPVKAHEANRTYAMLHGFAARIGDAAALQKSAENGYKITEAARRAEVVKMVEHYHAGGEDWNIRVAGEGGKKAAPLNPAILAVAEKRGLTYEQAMAWVAEKAMEELIAG